MTERKIVLYLEQKTISEKYQKAFLRSMTDLDTNPRVVDYYVFNSLGAEINNIFEKFDISREILLDLRKRSIHKISLIKWAIVKRHLCKLETTEKPDNIFLMETFKSIADQKIPTIFIVDHEFLLERTKQRLNLIKQLNAFFVKEHIFIVNKNDLSPNPLKYRIYLGERLLIERYYPIDIEHNRMIAETVFLHENASGELRLESNFDLQIKRVEIDGQKHEAYSTSFQLLHTDK